MKSVFILLSFLTVAQQVQDQNNNLVLSRFQFILTEKNNTMQFYPDRKKGHFSFNIVLVNHEI